MNGWECSLTQDHPSEQVVLQRIRNRVIEVLEIAASYEEQMRYQAKVPYINVPDELCSMWFDDLVSENWQSWFTPPVFTPEEIDAVTHFDKIYRTVVAALPPHQQALSELIGSTQWEQLRTAASESLKAFNSRGRLSEEQEIDQ
jgi:hypothetical protein